MIDGVVCYVQGGITGRIYAIAPNRIYALNGFGEPCSSTCWGPRTPTPVAVCDVFWSMQLALEIEEERILNEFPWTPTLRN